MARTDPGPAAGSSLNAQQYAMWLLQMLQDYEDETIRVDTVILVVKLLTRHPVDNAVIFATGEPYQFGACEFDSYVEASRFFERLSENVRYASILNGHFEVYRYPYRSRVMDDWVFVQLDRPDQVKP